MKYTSSYSCLGSFCIYADILGFEKLAEEIKKYAKFKSIDYVRNSIILEPILKEIRSAIESHYIKYIGSLQNPSSDDFKFTTSEFFNAKEILLKLSSIQIPFEGFDTIPVIFAIDYQEEPHDDVKDIATQSWISFLKSNIVGRYKLIKEKLNNNKIKNTFVIITKNAYDNLDYLERIKFNQFRLNLYEFVYESDESYIRELEQRSKFLELIGGHKDRKINSQLDLYKKITTYEEIKNKLSNEHVVFLTGPSGFGKTLTGIFLLYEYFNKSYVPIKHSKKIKIDELKENILKNSNAIYLLDDIFSKIENKDLKKLLDVIKFPGENYVIVTIPLNYLDKYSRDLDENHMSFINSRCYEISTRTYLPVNRTFILEDYAQYYRCKWRSNSELKSIISQSVSNSNYLESPLAIDTFCYSTRDELDFRKIKSIMEKCSQDLVDYFASLINNSSKEKIQIYFLVYCLANPQVETISRLLEQITSKDFLILSNDYLLSFEEDKIKFTHPLISSGFELFLKKFLNIRKNNNLTKRILNAISKDQLTTFYDKFNCFYNVKGLTLDESIIEVSYNLINSFKSELLQTFYKGSSSIDIFKYLEMHDAINLSIHSVIVSERYFEDYSTFLILVLKIEYEIGKKAGEIISSYPKNLIEIYGPEVRGPITPELLAADSITYKDSAIIDSVFSKVYYLNEKGYGEIYDKMINDSSCIEVLMGRILGELSTWLESKTIETSSRIPHHVIVKSFLIQIPKNPLFLLTIYTYKEYFSEKEIFEFVSEGIKNHPNHRVLYNTLFNN